MTTVLRFTTGTLVCLSLAACGGSAPQANTGSASAGTEENQPNWQAPNSSFDEAPNEELCEDGTCFSCGEGICPRGAHCDEDAEGGPACAWLPECSGAPTCSCVVKVLGDSCSCREEDGGPVVSCE